MSTIADKARNAGVVGAGGAGFPTYVKLNSSVKYFIANGAECEPLLHKDKELMLTGGETILKGLQIAAETTGASRIYFAAKQKYPDSYNFMAKMVREAGFEMLGLGNYYPSGDEYELVWEATKQLIPPGGIPLQVDTVVNNVETLYNLALAANDIPVTDTYVTVNGAVKSPGTFWAPIGTSLQELIDAAGGAETENPVALFNGAMMGSIERDLNKCVVTRTSAGLIVVPEDHHLVKKKSEPKEMYSKIGKSCCDQCTDCTALCPRYLLGYAIEPHTVMRSLGFTGSHNPIYDQFGLLCCECNICTLYACPEDLNPKQVCVSAKKALASEDRQKDYPPSREIVHEMKNARRVPLDKLTQRLGLMKYNKKAPHRDDRISPQSVFIPFQQHVGAAAEPVVRVGDLVTRGDIIGRTPEEALGVPVHTSITGKITLIEPDGITVVQ